SRWSACRATTGTSTPTTRPSTWPGRRNGPGTRSRTWWTSPRRWPAPTARRAPPTSSSSTASAASPTGAASTAAGPAATCPSPGTSWGRRSTRCSRVRRCPQSSCPASAAASSGVRGGTPGRSEPGAVAGATHAPMRPSELIDRLERRAARQPRRIRGRNPAAVALHVVRRFVDVRVTGLAAEMTYYTLLSLVPLTTALGAGLGALEGLVGAERVTEIEEALVDGVEALLSEELSADVAAPLVRELLREQRTGVAIGGLLVALWLAGRVFRAAIRALDDAYEVEERRTLLQQWGLSLAFLLGGIVVGILSLAMFVIGPLLGGGRRVAEWAGFGGA